MEVEHGPLEYDCPLQTGGFHFPLPSRSVLRNAGSIELLEGFLKARKDVEFPVRTHLPKSVPSCQAAVGEGDVCSKKGTTQTLLAQPYSLKTSDLRPSRLRP